MPFIHILHNKSARIKLVVGLIFFLPLLLLGRDPGNVGNAEIAPSDADSLPPPPATTELWGSIQ